MDHPSSPNRPHSPPPDQRHRMSYRPPPAAYSYPPYPPYGPPPPSSPYGPPHGYSSRPPPAGYPHHAAPYGYAYPPGPRGAYHSGYEAPYPPSRPAGPYRGGVPRTPQALSSAQASSPQKGDRASPSPKSSPNRSPRDGDGSRSSKPTDHVEVERLRAVAAAELTHEEVKPIQSDFHFFAKKNLAKFRKDAEEEVRKSLKPDEKLDQMLVNSNLNNRLKRAWENLTNDERDAFMVKEEEDRRRFMEEDEIASRHCATLTARGKSPRTPEKSDKTTRSEERQESETVPATSPDRESTPGSKSGDDKSEDSDEVIPEKSESKRGDTVMEDKTVEIMEASSPQKRSSPPAEGECQESPAKRNRQGEEPSS